MRRKSKLFIAMILFGLTTTGCSMLPSPVNRPNSKANEQQVEQSEFEKKTREIYNLYLAQGGTMTYEEWLESIRGEAGQDGATPYIGSNGNWYIDGRDTGVRATGRDGQDGKDGVDGKDGQDGRDGVDGQDGKDGQDGITPHIGANGNWWIGEQDTGIKAITQTDEENPTPYIGENGNWWFGKVDTGIKAEGQDGLTPFIGENGNWWIGNQDTGVKAAGIDGQDGIDGQTPFIGENGNWWIGNNDTGIKAEGKDGADGADGADGKDGTDGLTPYIGTNGNWWIGERDTGVDAKGNKGDTGVGITSINYNGEGELIVAFDDGRVVNLGVIASSLHQHTYECENVPATCTQDGYYRFTCKTCGHVETVINKAQGHLFEAWREKVVATCRNDGVKSRKCSVCGYEETEVIPAHDHTPSENCVFDANKHWHYCTECGIALDEHEHVLNNYKCTVCSYEKSSVASPDGMIYGLSDDGASYALISIGTCTDKIIDIPASYNGYPVTRISTGAFQGTDITSVTMPDTIEQVGNRAFYGCGSLTSIVLSNNLKTISSECFTGSGLTSIVIPDSVTRIEGSAFRYCYSLESLVLSNSLEYIGYGAFQDCDSMMNVVIPSSLNDSGGSSFSWCDLLANVVIENGVKSLSCDMFYACGKLASITIPSSVYYIGDNCFAGTGLESAVFEQPEGWYMNGDENVYKEILSVPELAARQLKNSNTSLNCRLVTQNLYTIGAAVLNIGETRNANATRSPDTATSPITYESLDTSIATVDENGNITAVGNGKTKVLAESAGVISEINIYIGEPAYSLNNSNAADNDYTSSFTAGDYGWGTNGIFSKSNWNGLSCVRAYDNLWNNNPISSISTIVVTVYVHDPVGTFSMSDVEVSAGKAVDNMLRVNYKTWEVKVIGSGEYNGEHEVGIATLAYEIPEGCSYFNIRFNGDRYIKNISFF